LGRSGKRGERIKEGIGRLKTVRAIAERLLLSEKTWVAWVEWEGAWDCISAGIPLEELKESWKVASVAITITSLKCCEVWFKSSIFESN
jgi:hypothetical protein